MGQHEPATSIALLASLSVAISIAGCASSPVSSDALSSVVAPPARVFVPPLRECPHDRGGMQVQEIGKGLLGKTVAVRGFLTLSPGRSCDCAHCPADEWRIVGEEARVYDPREGRSPTALIVSLPVLLPGDDLGSPDLDVIATGVLREAPDQTSHGYFREFLLEDADVCRLTAASPKHANPFQLPPSTICIPDHG